MKIKLKSKCSRFSSLNDALVYQAKSGRAHREDGPAIIHKSGTKLYFCNGIKYGDLNDWAMAVLKFQGHCAYQDPDAIRKFLKEVMQKQTKELI